jgi:dephospho-CoA kinase
MPVIGVAGGIASGKTTVCKFFERCGAIIIDADSIGRQIVETNPDLLRKLVETFNDEILDQQGRLDRRKLGNIVFRDDSSRKKLNDLVHPPLLQELRRQVDDCLSNNPRSIIIIDAALLLEWEWRSLLDVLIVVRSTSKQRQERLVKHVGLTPKEAEDRIFAQSDLESKGAGADYIISNNGTVSDLERQSQEVWDKMMENPKIQIHNSKSKNWNPIPTNHNKKGQRDES